MTETSIRHIKSRHHMIRYFDGYTSERMDELQERKLKRPLVKTQLLEIVDKHSNGSAKGLSALTEVPGLHMHLLEESLFLLSSDKLGDIGFVEVLKPRIIAVYSTRESKELTPLFKQIVNRSHELDFVWLSGLTLGVLWNLVMKLSHANRFTRLTFTHDSVFDVDSEKNDQENEEDETSDSPATENEDDLSEVIERRTTSFRLVDRVGVIQGKLSQLQKLYSPLYAISQLRFPSPVGRGGHDFYDNGRVTNRSDSFRDHRSHVSFVVRIYEELLNATEQKAWYSIKESVRIPDQFKRIVGAPVVVKFQEALSEDVFDYWISSTFERKRNRFRLWGHPIRLGPTKVHVYGVDRHLWQSLFLELTATGLTAIIPNGTCGNTVHRLVTNIQRYLDPGATVFIGDVSYKEMVEQSARSIRYEHE